MDAKMLSIINNRVHRQKQSPNEFSQVPTTLPLEAFSFHISDMIQEQKKILLSSHVFDSNLNMLS